KTGRHIKSAFNYLTIPRGGQFFVELSDGTKIWLNSESKLKYPVKFIEGETRTVELVYGEAYFDVSPSNLNKGGAFHLQTKSQEINVLGTEFNVKAYNDEHEISTTLVEGSVIVKKGEAIKLLKPNQQSLISSDKDFIDVIDVEVSQEVSWVKGLFAFNEESLDQMMVVLSRWYDVEFVFENAKHKSFVFTGMLKKTGSVEEILKLIAATSEGQVKFEINEKRITIK
ncbi:MAG: FecR family protein, partial [Flavobacteriaceae bacterium]